MHLNCSGEARAGLPTVILEAGSSDFSINWAFVQPEVATTTRVCSYDRSGSGWSDLGPYAATYPGEVRGIVFVDAGHEDSLMSPNGKLVREWELATGQPVPPPLSNPIRIEQIPANIRQQLEVAAAQNAGQPVGPPHNKLPPDLQRARAWAMSQIKWVASTNSPFGGDEILALKQARAATPYPLGDMPVVVLTRGIPIDPTEERGVEREQDRLRLKADLAALSRNSRQVTASPTTGHHIHIDEPQLVIRAIREVVTAAAR
jgi:pimeloyl-ACP methyl ester carboxylesterase